MSYKTTPSLRLSILGASHFDLPSRSVIKRWIQKSLGKDAFLTIKFVGIEEGLELNSSYRKKNYATNVLTFDYSVDPVIEADIVICEPVLRKEAQEQNKTFKEHLAHLIVHGVLHSQGYDHMQESEAREMEQLETDILVSLGFQEPYPEENYQPQPLKHIEIRK